MAYSIDPVSADCYPGTSVLVNKFDIRDEEKLAEVESQAGQLFERLRDHGCFRGLPHDEFVNEITDFYCDTNILHPFREGNGRTQRAFLTQLIHHAGYHISFADLDTDLLMVATIQAAHGVTDLLRQILCGVIV